MNARHWGIGASVIATAALAFGWVGSGQVLYPESPCILEHYVFCGTPESAGLPYEDFEVHTSDGVNLDGWYVSSEGSDRTIVFVHGHGGTIQEGLRYASVLHEAGFNLAFFSLRGNMGSGHPYTMGDLERRDARAIVDEVAARGGDSIGVFGFSMGAVVAIGAMAEDERIDAGLFNSPFASVSDQLAHSLRSGFGLPPFPLVPITMWVARLRSGANFHDASAIKNIARIHGRPVFVVHSQEDPLVPFDHGKRVFEAANDPKVSWFPEIGGHVFEWNVEPATAEAQVLNFFDSTL